MDHRIGVRQRVAPGAAGLKQVALLHALAGREVEQAQRPAEGRHMRGELAPDQAGAPVMTTVVLMHGSPRLRGNDES